MSPAGPEPATRWGVVAAALLAGVVTAMQFGKAPPALPEVRAELALGLVAGGWIASIFNATAATFGIAGGGAVDAFGRRRTLIGGLACLAVGSFLGSLAGDGTSLLAARFLEGMGFVLVVVAAPSLIAASAHPRDHRLALSMWSTYMPTGMAIIAVASALLLAPLGWRGLWQVNTAVVVAALVALVAATRGVPRFPAAASERATIAGAARTIARPGPWLLAACFATYSFQWIAVMAWLPTFLIEEQGRTLTESALLTALVIAVNIPGNLAGAWLLHRGAPRWLLIAAASAVMGLFAAAILLGTAPDPAKLVMCLAFSFFGGVLPASILSGVPQHAPTPGLVGVTNGVIVQGVNLGSLSGPPALAALVAASGAWRHAGWLLALVALAGVALALVLRAVERRA